MSTAAHGSAVSLSHPYPGEPPPVRDRGDACPGTLRLHTADDGALARVRVPGGALTARQALALADAADRFGDGELHLTSRGNVQLRGLPEDCGADLADVLAGAGLLPSARHERVRNVVASPLSGLDGRGHVDVLPWVAELDRLLCASPAAADLSGRFLFALDDGRRDVASLGADVTVVAESADEGFARANHQEPEAPPAPAQGAGAGHGAATVYVGGTAALRVALAEAPRAALLAAELFLEAVRARGAQSWRIRELPDGEAVVARALARRLAGSRTVTSARGLGATTAEPPAATGPEPGVVHAPEGRAALSVTAPFGTFTAHGWRLLATTARAHGSGALRLTPWRGVVVPGLRPERAGARLAELAADGLVTTADSPWHGVGACTGRPGCAKSLADVRADARAAVHRRDRRDRREGGDPPVYWSGCARRCGRPRAPHVDRVATGDGRYDVGDPQTTAAER